MATRARTSSSKNQTNIVPILFTVGVIGWGFFAIDRLTRPQSVLPTLSQPADMSNNVSPQKKSWKENLLNFMERFDKDKVKQDLKGNLSVIDENETAFMKGYKEVRTDEASAPLSRAGKAQDSTVPQVPPVVALPTTGLRLYFYRHQNSSQLPVLTPVEYSFSGSSDQILKQVFIATIGGPASTEKSDLLDSFPVKPKIISARINGDTLFMDANQDFGRGVSWQMLQLQLKQLWQTAVQFQNVKNLSITINGERASYIGGDGLALPVLINKQTLTAMQP